MKKLFIVAALGMVLASGAASAQTSYNYVEGSYATRDFKTKGFDNRSADMWSLKGSKSLGNHLYVVGGYTKGLDTDLTQGTVALGLGLHTPIASKADVYAQVSGTTVVADRKDATKYNYNVESGLRWQVAQKLELRGGVTADNLRGQRMDTVQWRGFVGAEYALTKTLKVGLTAAGKEDDLSGIASVRLYF